MIDRRCGSPTVPSSSGPTLTRRGGGAHSIVGTIIGVIALVAIWSAFSQRQPELILPSPAQTWSAFTGIITDGSLIPELGRTLWRSASGVAVAFVLGAIWGGVAGVSRWTAAITQPALSTLMALPPVVLVALAMVWLGPGGSVTQLVVALVALPLIVVAVKEAVRDVDGDLLEMASVFEMSRWSTFRHVISPSVASPVIAAVSVTVGQALRVAVMAELLAASDGVGAKVAQARTYLLTAQLFAWALVLVATVLVIETLVLRPLTSRVLRWRDTGSDTDSTSGR